MIPIEILHKPDKLTNEEYEYIKQHPIMSINLLTSAGMQDTEILNLILSHHERIDGLGYPYGISNENINRLNRILTICDSYDAMRYKRSYHDSLEYEYIKNELISKSGTQFDPEYVELFIKYIDELQYFPKQ